MCFHEGVPVPTCSPALPGGAGGGDGTAVGSFLSLLPVPFQLSAAPAFSRHLRTSACSSRGGPDQPSGGSRSRRVPGCRAPPARGRGVHLRQGQLCSCRAGRGGAGHSLFCTVSGSSKRPPRKYPSVLQAVEILSLLEIIITGGRSNFSETISSTPETSLLTSPSFVVHLLSESICAPRRPRARTF